MDEYDRLLAFTKAAGSCDGQARGFIESFGDDPEFSTDSLAASMQAKEHYNRALSCVDRIQKATQDWIASVGALDYVGMAVGITLPPIFVDVASYQTAHEAAHCLAQAVIAQFRRAEGSSDAERLKDLARRLAGVQWPADFCGRIQGESHAAGELVPLPDASAGEAGAEAGNLKRKSRAGRKKTKKVADREQTIREERLDSNAVQERFNLSADAARKSIERAFKKSENVTE